MKYPEPKNVRTYSQHQMQMFPPSVRSLIEDDHLCLVVDDVVKVLDLSCLYQKVSAEGNPPYHPAMMLKILFYSYASGIFSSRNIAKATRENIAFIYLTAWQQPDFRTISDFRKNNLDELKELFVQIVMLCKHMGMIKLGHVSIDGTKVKANASDAKTYDNQRFEKEINRLIEHADAVDDLEDQQYGADQSGDELPASIRNQNERISKLKQLQKELAKSEKEKINTTDADAVFMKTSNGIKTSYNGQAAVDQEHQVIIAADVTNQPADVEQLIPMIDQAEENTSGDIDACSADSGYSSGENLRALEDRPVEAYIPDRDYQAQARGKKQKPFHKNEFVYDQQRDLYICPEGEELVFSHRQKRRGKQPLLIYQCKSCRQCQFFGQCTTNDNGRTISRHPYEKQLKQMREKLDSDQGKAIYAHRKHIVEPVFGQIKSVMGFTSFLLRGLDKVKGEFNLVAIAHNLRKIWLYLKAGNINNVKNRLTMELKTL
ncbi:MAG: IS1182 family transposase [Desulfobacterales bacterium]